MNRRNALKKIGIGTGAISVSPAIVSIFQSCQNNTGKLTLIHFSNDEFSIVSKLMDLILPKTDIPGAIELKLPEFLDGYIDLILPESRKKELSEGLDKFVSIALKDSQKKKSSKLDSADLDKQLTKYLKADVNEQKKWDDQFNQFRNLKNKKTEIPPKAFAYNFIKELRSLSIIAFRTNEYIGEQVLAYAPIPGEQRGCVDLNEATGGKLWSL